MRCVSCNKRLNDHESVRKSAVTGDYLDMCNHCFATIAEDVPDLDDGSADGYEEEFEDGQEEGTPYDWDFYRE